MVTFNTMCILIPIFILMLCPSDKAIRLGNNNNNNNNYNINVNERFLKTISHHYCDRLTGTHVVLLAENTSASFYKVLLESFQSTFYMHNTLVGNFSLSAYHVLYIEDERFFEKLNYNRQFWHTTKTYLIVSEKKLRIEIIWSQIQRIWETYGVFKISLLHSDDLKVLRIFDRGFRKYERARKPNYGINNVKKHPLRAAVFPRMPSLIFVNGSWTGFDWNTLEVFSNRMNFTLQPIWFSEQSGFGRIINGTYTGILAEVVYGRADVAFNSRFLDDPSVTKAYRYSRASNLDYICFVVPQAEKMSRMQILWKTFTVEVWLCVAVTYALMTRSMGLFNRFDSRGGRRKISNPLMTGLQVVLGMGVYRLPRYAAGRLLLVSCSAAFFVVVSLFQASMVTRLSVEPGKHEIDTLEELDRSGMEIRTSLQFVRDSLASHSYTRSLAQKIDMEKDRRDYVTSTFGFTARVTHWNVNKYSNYIGRYKNHSVALHIVRECPLKYYLSYAVALDFPFFDELNDCLTRMHEAGLYSKWRMDTQNVVEEYYKPVEPNQEKVLKAYSLNDLWFAFVLLFIGYVISTVVLTFEFVFRKIKKKKKSRIT